MKLITPLALVTTLATLASALPLRIIIPLDASSHPPSAPHWVLPPSAGAFAPGPHHLHHFAPSVADGPGGGIGILPPGLKAELERVAHLQREGGLRMVSSDGGERKGRKGGRKGCHGGRGGGGGGGSGGGWLEALFGGNRAQGHHHQQHQNGGSMMVIEPDGSRTVIHHTSSGMTHHYAPYPHDPDLRPLFQRLNAKAESYSSFTWFLCFFAFIAVLFKTAHLVELRREARAAAASQIDSTPPPSAPPAYPGSVTDKQQHSEKQAFSAAPPAAAAASHPDYYHSFRPTPNSLLASVTTTPSAAPPALQEKPIQNAEDDDDDDTLPSLIPITSRPRPSSQQQQQVEVANHPPTNANADKPPFICFQPKHWVFSDYPGLSAVAGKHTV